MTVRRMLLALAVLPLVLGGCGDSTGPGSSVAIAFRSAIIGASGSATSPAMFSLMPSESQSIGIDGSNGTLRIDELFVLVAEFELKRADVSCDDLAGEDDDDCEELELPPSFVEVPLDGPDATLVRQEVPPGTYRRIEFEVEDLEDDEDDDDAAAIADLLADVIARFPEWPRNASMVAIGVFQPSGGGDARPFTVYFEAELEIELEFDTPLTIAADDPDRTIAVTVDPRLWFRRGDGTVMDLSAFDFATFQDVVEFEFEMEDGFADVEFDDD